MPAVSADSVLLVDDDPSIRALLSRQLEKGGFEVRQAEDGIDGLTKLRDGLPKVIISDVQMPRMSGAEFISVVRRRFPSIPVIAISGIIPSEFPAEAKPDLWLEKGALRGPTLSQAVRDLARNTPDHADLPPVTSVQVRTRLGGNGYVILICTDCLRQFQVTSTPEDMTAQRTAVCVHCEACVSFLLDNSKPA